MLFQLILSALPTLAHFTSVGKATNQLNSPETHVNLGQLQANFDNTLASTGHYLHYQTLIPSKLVTQQVSNTQPENYGNALTIIPHTQISPFSNFGNVQLSELPLINAHYKPNVYNAVPHYAQFGYSSAFRPAVASIPKTQNIASPQLNFEVKKLANVDQKGDF
jgi:hypothetical protein